MTRCVALLRAVNLGPHNKVSMAALRDIAGGLRLSNAQTVVLSGNLVFDDPKERATAEPLQRAIVGREKVRAVGRELFVYYPDGIGRSKLTAALITRHLGANGGTGRNWNTVQKIAVLLG